jgi:DNA-binding NarL/FixJ family response regulator
LNGTPISSTAEPLTILIVDDFVAFRGALRQFFEKLVGFTVVGEASDGRSAVETALRLSPDIVLMDVRMPTWGGAESTRRIKRVLPGIHIIGMFSHDEIDTEKEMTAAGCSAFVAKESVHTLPSIIARLAGRQVAHSGSGVSLAQVMPT